MTNVKIIPYESRYAQDFERLNIAWLEKYFYVEAYDAKVLANADEYIIAAKGEILLAELSGVIVGVVALMYHGDDLELTKMAVDENYQGQGIGKLLMQAALKRAREMNPAKIFLLTSSTLGPANSLYEKSGFVNVPLHSDDNDVYERCDRRWELPFEALSA
ncbi:MAG: GNAT family N-acetyltransferase [Rickettsiales bacterium]|nr:GNAT family N-acetyltransferase [Rickettsiales bacterium]